MSEMWQEAMIAAFREMVNRAVLFLPKLMAMVTFLMLGLAMGWLVKVLLMRILNVVRFEVFCERIGLTAALTKAGVKQRISASRRSLLHFGSCSCFSHSWVSMHWIFRPLPTS